MSNLMQVKGFKESLSGVTFRYGGCSVKDLQIHSSPSKTGGKPMVNGITLGGEGGGIVCKPSKRFWGSVFARFGFAPSIFKYYNHTEVFQRISEVSPNDGLRFCVEQRPARGTDPSDLVVDEKVTTLLAVTSPKAPIVGSDDLFNLLDKYDSDEVTYHDGVVRSRHAPRNGGEFQIAGDGFQNRYVIDTPLDGYGRPNIYLSLLRLVCTNGAVGYGAAFRSELSLGKGEDNVSFALVRALDGFNNEEGFNAMRERWESAGNSWASVNEVNKMYKLLVRLHQKPELLQTGSMEQVPAPAQDATDSVTNGRSSGAILNAFHGMTGDLSKIYGLANLDALSVKRQRTLPTQATVYDMLNFASEVATHRANPEANRNLQAYIGELISNEFDLEGTKEQFMDYKDMFLNNESANEALRALQGTR